LSSYSLCTLPLAQFFSLQCTGKKPRGCILLTLCSTYSSLVFIYTLFSANIKTIVRFWSMGKFLKHGWDLGMGWRMRSSLVVALQRLTVNAQVATALGSIPASVDTVESEERQMKQCLQAH
jgi:hypothetical protein